MWWESSWSCVINKKHLKQIVFSIAWDYLHDNCNSQFFFNIISSTTLCVTNLEPQILQQNIYLWQIQWLNRSLIWLYHPPINHPSLVCLCYLCSINLPSLVYLHCPTSINLLSPTHLARLLTFIMKSNHNESWWKWSSKYITTSAPRSKFLSIVQPLHLPSSATSEKEVFIIFSLTQSLLIASHICKRGLLLSEDRRTVFLSLHFHISCETNYE